jgi:hypothetical protein
LIDRFFDGTYEFCDPQSGTYKSVPIGYIYRRYADLRQIVMQACIDLFNSTNFKEMKTHFLIFFLTFGSFAFVCNRSFAQIKSKYPAAIFIDSQRVDYKIDYLDPQNISDIGVYNGLDSPGHRNGSIYITRKNPHPLLLSLDDIARNQHISPGNRILYIINDSLITDTSRIRIESSIILRIQPASLKDVTYLKDFDPRVALLFIETSSKKRNNPGEKTILIQ